MKNIVRAERVNEFEAKMRSRYGLKSIDLINNAALCAFDVIKDRVENKSVLILVGKGNNGSDGLSLFFLLKKLSANVKVYLYGEGKSVENKSFRLMLNEDDITNELSGYDVYIDSLVGSSFSGAIRDDLKGILDTVNSFNADKIAVDVPSCYYFNADLTVTFTFYKLEQFRLPYSSGHIVLCNPGFPSDEIESFREDAFLLEDSDYKAKKLKDTDYKNKRGHLLIIAGSEKYKGAAILSSKAAFHAGCGLVSLKSDALKDVQYYYPSVILNNGDIDFDRYDALLAGPGLAENADRSYLSFHKSMVLDADALSTIEKGDNFNFNAILTPHLGESKRLSEKLGCNDTAKDIAKEVRAIVVKKSAIVEISDGIRTFYYLGLNPSLGVAGSGDVLSGIIAALLSSGMESADAAINGVLLHQISGKKLRAKLGFYDSMDLIYEIGRNR